MQLTIAETTREHRSEWGALMWEVLLLVCRIQRRLEGVDDGQGHRDVPVRAGAGAGLPAVVGAEMADMTAKRGELPPYGQPRRKEKGRRRGDRRRKAGKPERRDRIGRKGQ